MNTPAKYKRPIALSIVKLDPRYADQLLSGNLINTPQAITQIAMLVRRDGVKALPTFVIDGKKVLEGPQLPQAVRYAIINEITKTTPNITRWMRTRGEAIAKRTEEKQTIQEVINEELPVRPFEEGTTIIETRYEGNDER